MGLDTTHDAWHGSYGGFGVWRRKIARAAGIIEDGERLYPAVWDGEEIEPCPIDWDFWDTQTNYKGRWVEDPEDVIWVLLAHSDCDGHIKKRFLLPLADRLGGGAGRRGGFVLHDPGLEPYGKVCGGPKACR